MSCNNMFSVFFIIFDGFYRFRGCMGLIYSDAWFKGIGLRDRVDADTHEAVIP